MVCGVVVLQSLFMLFEVVACYVFVHGARCLLLISGLLLL